MLGDGPVARAGTDMRNLFARVGRDPLDIDPRDVDVVVNADLTKATTLLGAFDPTAIHRAAERAGYDRTGEYGGFGTYERRDRPYAIAVSSDAVVHSWVPDGAPGVVERVIDAGRGAADRYHGTHDRYARLVRAVGGGTTSWIHPAADGGTPDGVVGSASATTFADGAAYFARAYLFEDAAATSADAMRDALTANEAYPRSAPLDVTVDGRMGRAEFRRDPEDLFDPRRRAGGRGPTRPEDELQLRGHPVRRPVRHGRTGRFDRRPRRTRLAGSRRLERGRRLLDPGDPRRGRWCRRRHLTPDGARARRTRPRAVAGVRPAVPGDLRTTDA
ncbi:hypothetical protein BRD11_03240 [Halobacteriales archaeon SW_12_69_24]|nr:MAG: hypothetical protein BRD11_03240 [Halobacteriales archaeon SW_12_69_24]